MTSAYRAAAAMEDPRTQVDQLGRTDRRCMDVVALELAGVPRLLVDAATVGSCASAAGAAEASSAADAIRRGALLAASESELDTLAGGDDPDEFGYVWDRREGRSEGCR